MSNDQDENSCVDWESLAECLHDGEEQQKVVEFAEALGPRLRRFLLCRGLQVVDAEGLAVTLLGDIVLLVRDGRFRALGTGSFMAWCFAVTRNRLADWHRSEERWLHTAPSTVLNGAQVPVISTSPVTSTEQVERDERGGCASRHVELLAAIREALSSTAPARSGDPRPLWGPFRHRELLRQRLSCA